MSPKRPGTMSDDERANIGARHRRTPVGGVQHAAPNVEIHDESTLPPQQMPELPRAVERVPDRSTRDALELQGKAIEGLTDAMGKVWDARNDKERFDRIEHSVDKFGERVDKLIDGIMKTNSVVEEFLMPAVKMLMGRVDTLAEDRNLNRARIEAFWSTQWPETLAALKAISPRLTALENGQYALNLETKALGDRIAGLFSQFQGVAAQGSALEGRVLKIERSVEDVGKEKLTDRVVALEKRNSDSDLVTKTNRWWIAKIFAAGSAIGGVAAYVISHIKDWLAPAGH